MDHVISVSHSKVRLAQVYGAAAILLYLDPYDYPSPDRKVFPYSRDIPGTAVQRGTVLLGDSDPLTPGYPSTGLFKLFTSIMFHYLSINIPFELQQGYLQAI